MKINKRENGTLLITGAGGFVGRHLVRAACAAGWNTVAFWHFVEPTFIPGSVDIQVDITDEHAVRSNFDDLRPSAVIHCAAVAGIRHCADDKITAAKVNIHGTENIAKSAARTGAYMIYVSTDLVFNGIRGNYGEFDPPNPACFYGSTKYLGELSVISSKCQYSIARLATVYGHGMGCSDNFLDSLLVRLQRGETSKLFDDEYRSFVFIDDACAKLLKLAERQLNGIFHIAGPERLSSYDFGLKVAKRYGFPTSLLHRISSDETESIEKRPKDCSLSNEKTVTRLGRFQPVETALDRHL